MLRVGDYRVIHATDPERRINTIHLISRRREICRCWFLESVLRNYKFIIRAFWNLIPNLKNPKNSTPIPIRINGEVSGTVEDPVTPVR